LHYRAGGKHQLRNNEFTFELLDEKGDQIKQGLLFSHQSPELEIEGTDPVYSPKIEFNTTANHAPLAKGGHYKLLLVVTGYGIVPMANVRSFTITECCARDISASLTNKLASRLAFNRLFNMKRTLPFLLFEDHHQLIVRALGEG
jgi:hypothetical protein